MKKILEEVINYVKRKLNKEKISFLDSSCGDMNWMPSFLSNRTDVIFTGYDITPSNIEAHKERFRGKPWTFKVYVGCRPEIVRL